MSEEGEEEAPPKVLTPDLIKASLSQIGKTFDGTSYAFLKLDLTDKELESLCEDLGGYQHLRFLELNGNVLGDISVLAKIPYVLRLNLKGSRVPKLDLFNNEETFSHLQFLNLQGNRITALTPLKLPKLIHLNLCNNEIATAESFEGHANLRKLELRANKLKSLVGLKNMPQLAELYVAENEVASLMGLEELPSLTTLHLRKNKVEKVEEEGLPDLSALTYLNLRENPLGTVADVGRLKVFPRLSKLHVQGSTFAEEQADNTKREMLIVFPRLAVINKEEVTNEDREDAIAESAERFRLAEEARKEAERAAREAEEKERGEPEES